MIWNNKKSLDQKDKPIKHRSEVHITIDTNHDRCAVAQSRSGQPLGSRWLIKVAQRFDFSLNRDCVTRVSFL
jgi:hypothetical protein